MKKFISLGLLVFTVFTGFAQVQRTTAVKKEQDSTLAISKMDKMGRKEMMKELNLTKEQKIKFKELKTANKESIQAVESDSTLTAAQKKVKVRELKKQQLSNLKSILTPEQFEKFKQLRKEGKLSDKTED